MRRKIATVPIGSPDGVRLGDIETVYELDGWRHVTVVAQPVNDDTAGGWEAHVFAETPTAEPRCTGCGGILIGSETAHGTCGHCGHRSIAPEPAAAKTGRLTIGEGLLAVVGGWAVGIALAVGVLLMAALGAAASWLAAYAGGWSRLIVATGAVTAVAALLRAAISPDTVR